MPALVWDQLGERLFETGVEKGVFYKADGYGVAWNGLTSIDEDMSYEAEPVYFDGVKINDIVTVGDFTATLRAFTYPEEFLEYEGTIEDQTGFFILNQGLNRFCLSYQTRVGDDVVGVEAGYKIHILYNLTALPSQRSYQTISDSTEPLEFEWEISAIPENLDFYRPTAHAIFDSRTMDPYLLADLEEILYGGTGNLTITDHHDGTWSAESDDAITMLDETTFEITSEMAIYLDDDTYTISSDDKGARLPSLRALSAFIRKWARLVIVDNGDGSWTASSPDPDQITMIDETTFQIVSDTAVYLDADTYTITSSEKNEEDIWLP